MLTICSQLVANRRHYLLYISHFSVCCIISVIILIWLFFKKKKGEAKIKPPSFKVKLVNNFLPVMVF